MPIKSKLLIVIEGGIVQDIVSPDPELFRDVEVISIDYDTEGACPEDVFQIEQSEGDVSTAYCGWRDVTRVTIDHEKLSQVMMER